MKQLLIILLIGSLSVLIFDTLGSFASKYFQVNYILFIFGSVLIYASTGYFSARYGSLIFAIFISAIVGLIDSTLGWYISWLLGPGRVDFELNSANIISTVFFVICLSAVFGFIGGLINYFTLRYFN